MTNIRRAIATFSLVAILSTFVVSTAVADTFKDVLPGDQAYTAVEALAANGTIAKTADTFAPNAPLTRGEAAKYLVMEAGYELLNPASAHFPDVAVGSTYFQYIETAWSNGIITGFPDGTFKPAATVQRDQFAVMAVKAFDFALVTPAVATFTDVLVGNWAFTAVETAVENGVIYGMTPTVFAPADPITKGQGAMMTYRATTAVATEDEEEETDDLEGTAGSITVTAKSTYTGEEVGEDTADVKVMAFQVEADDSSDVEIKSLKLEFAQKVGGNSDKMTDYFDSVGVLFNGDEVGTADPASFSENSDIYTKFVTLDGAIIRAGEKATFIVTVSALDNLDSGDINDDDWTVDLLAVRFVDGEGVVTTDGFTAKAMLKHFDFASFASANSVELEADLTDENPDEGVAIVSDSDTTEVLLMSHTLTADGTDFNIEDLVYTLTSAGVDIADVAQELVLRWDDGASEQSQSLNDANTSETVTFDDLDIDLAEDEEMTFELYATVYKLDGDPIAEGSTLSVALVVDSTVATDGVGEDVEAADLTGAADGETQHLFTIAPEVTYVSSSVTPVDNGSDPAESATISLVVDVKALGGTIYLNGDDEDDTDPVDTRSIGGVDKFALQGLVLAAVGADTLSAYEFTTSGNYTITASGADGEYYKITEGKTMRLTVNATITEDADATVLGGLKVSGVLFGTANTNAASRSANSMVWSDLLDSLKSGKTTLVGDGVTP